MNKFIIGSVCKSDIRYRDVRIYPLILWQPEIRIFWSENPDFWIMKIVNNHACEFVMVR